MMKKVLVLVAALSLVAFAANAQVAKNALGVRLGGGAGYGAELSYQLGMGDANRLELDLGFGGNDNYTMVGLTGTYQWVWPIGGQGFNWYAGPGAGLSLNTVKSSKKNNNDDFFGVAIGGQIGIGYDFKAPISLTIDTRPMWDFLADNDAFNWGLALGVRFRF